MDPNKIVKPGTVETAWITPDGSYITTDPAEAKKNGATHQVAASKATYADGRRQWIVYTGADRSLAEGTYSPAGPPAGTDPDVERSWLQQQSAASREQAQAERKKVSVTYEGSGPTRKRRTVYESGPDLVEDAPETTSTQATIGRVEGTPLPGGGFDNTKPIWVERDANGQQVGPAKPLTADQRQQWERDKNGGLTDQEIRDRGKPDAMVGKPTGNTRTRTQNGTTVKETEHLLPDGTKEWRTQTETTQPDRVGKPTGNTRTRAEGGQTIKETEYILPDGTKEWRTQTAPAEGNQPLPQGMPEFKPDPNKPGLGVIEYVQQLTALRSQRNPDGTPKLTDAQFDQFVRLAHQNATAEAGRLDTIRSAQATLQANEINQRNADLQASVSRLNSANTATQNALDTSMAMASNFTPASYAAMGGPILPALMAIQDARAGAWGGLNNPATIGAANYPMLAALQGMGMTAPNPNAVIPAVASLTAPAQPNALGLGGPGAVFTPGGTPAPAAAPPAAPAAAPAVSAPAMAAPAAPVAAPAAAPTPAGPPVRDDHRLDPGLTPMPPFVTPDQYQPAQPVNMDPSQGPVGQAPVILPGVLQAGVMAELSGKYPPDILQEAARSLGWA